VDPDPDPRIQFGGSGMFIPDPDFTHPGSRISDPGSKNQMKDIGKKKQKIVIRIRIRILLLSLTFKMPTKNF
jgi:hypothetical protein